HVGHWAAIEAPAGSTVELTSGTGRRALSPVGSSSGFSSAGPPIAWFGVDDARANRAKVVLPDGRVMRLTVGRDELIQLDC
ncbi:MAG: ASPIC/UnbV domain-containing protein, partial [Mycetocola sp.]